MRLRSHSPSPRELLALSYIFLPSLHPKSDPSRELRFAYEHEKHNPAQRFQIVRLSFFLTMLMFLYPSHPQDEVKPAKSDMFSTVNQAWLPARVQPPSFPSQYLAAGIE
ncbi:hypothetical protein D3C78_1220570 [compost metagenome]